MPGIRADFDLDLTAALQAVGQLQDAITTALTEAAAGFGEALSTALAQVSSTPVTITFDTSASESATSEIATVGADGIVISAGVDVADVEPAVIEAVAAAEQNTITLATVIEIPEPPEIPPIEIPPIELPIGVDASAADGGVASFVSSVPNTVIDIPVGIDPALAHTGIAELVAEAAATPVVLPAELDTSNAVGGLGEVETAAGEAAASTGRVGEAAQEASTGVAALEGAGVALGASAGIARGSITGAAAATGGFGIGAKVATGLVLELVASIAELVHEGEKGVAAEQRLNLIFGQQAAAIKQINLGGLKGELSELALETGSSITNIQQSVANLGLIAETSGFTEARTKALTNNFSALALEVTALKPSLGDAGDVLNLLVPALSRGGRFALNFGLSLSSADINARALADTGKVTVVSLTSIEKAAAGAEIATERLGDKLGENFDAGIEQTAVQFKKLGKEIEAELIAVGKPLVAPTLEALKSLLPVAFEVGEGVASIAAGAVAIGKPLVSAAIPAMTAFGAALKAIGPTLQLIAVVLEHIPVPILTAVAGFFVLSSALNAVAAIGPLIVRALSGVVQVAFDAGIALSTVAAGDVALLASAGALVPVLAAVAAIGVGVAFAFGAFGSKAKEAAPATADFAEQLLKVNEASGAFADRGELADFTANVVEALSKSGDGLGKFAEKLNADGGKIKTALRGVGEGVDTIGDDLRNGGEGVGHFAEKLIESTDGADETLTRLANSSHLTKAALIDLLSLGDSSTNEVVIGFAQSQGDADKIKSITDIVSLFQDEAEGAQASAHELLNRDVVLGLLTASQKKELAALEASNAANKNYIDLAARVGEKITDQTEGIDRNRATWVQLAKSIELGVIAGDDFQAVAERLGVALPVIQELAENAADAFNEFADSAIEKLPQTTVVTQEFADAQAAAYGDAISAGQSAADAQKQFNEATGRGLDSQRRSIENAADAIDKANRHLDEAKQKQHDAGRTATTRSQVDNEIESANKAVETASEQSVAAADRLHDAQASLNDARQKAGEALAEAQKKQAEATKAFFDSLNPQNVVDALANQTKKLLTFQANFDQIVASGNKRLAKEILSLGPEAGASLADAAIRGGPDIQKSIDDQLSLVDKTRRTVGEDIREQTKDLPGIADEVVEEFGIKLLDLPETVATALDATLVKFGADSPQFKEAIKDAKARGFDVGISFGDGLAESLTESDQSRFDRIIHDVTSRFGPEAGAEVAKQGQAAALKASDTFGLNQLGESVHKRVLDSIGTITEADAAEAQDKFRELGTQMIQGLAEGVEAADAARSQQAVRNAILNALGAGRDAAKAHSPSVVFYELGLDLMLGLEAGVGSGVAPVEAIFTGLPALLAEDITTAGSDLGKSIGEGIIKGIGDTFPAVAAIAHALIKLAEDAASDEAERGSPSELFARLGVDLSEGLAHGITRSQDRVSAAAKAAVTAAHEEAAKAAAEAPPIPFNVGLPAPGLVKPGNLDPFNRPIVKNPDGTVSTTQSTSFQNEQGLEVLIPTVFDKAHHSFQESLAHFVQTGENFGTFVGADAADAFSVALHNKQEAFTKVAAQFETASSDGVNAALTYLAKLSDALHHGRPVVRSDAESLGGDLSGGIATGIDGSKDVAGDAAAKALLFIGARGRDAARAHSPSGLFADLGSDLAEGLAEGITSGHAAIATAATNAVKVAHDAVKTASSNTAAALVSPQFVAPTLIAKSAELQVAPMTASNPVAIDEDTSFALRSLAGTLESGVRATRPVEQTFNEKIDPLHAAAETVWALTSR